jgi:hypothetical protein
MSSHDWNYHTKRPDGTELDLTAAPLLRAIVAGVRERAFHSTIFHFEF